MPPQASLAGAGRIHLQQPSQGTCGLVRELLKDGIPGSPRHGLGGHSTCQSFDVKVFDHNQRQLIYYKAALLVVKIGPLVLNQAVSFGKQAGGFATALAALRTPCQAALPPPQENRGVVKLSGVGKLGTSRHSGPRVRSYPSRLHPRCGAVVWVRILWKGRHTACRSPA